MAAWVGARRLVNTSTVLGRKINPCAPTPRPWPILLHRAVAQENTPEQKGPWIEEEKKYYNRKLLDSGVAAVGVMATLTATKKVVSGLFASKGPTRAALAVAKTEVNLNPISEGNTVTILWQGKPCFVRHRTPIEIEEARKTDITTLRHPETDDDRAIRPEWQVLEANCTHLGCTPIAYKGDYQGYYCPCHGSHYDTSGRIRKGPAPLNLQVPPYKFLSDETIIIG